MKFVFVEETFLSRNYYISTYIHNCYYTTWYLIDFHLVQVHLDVVLFMYVVNVLNILYLQRYSYAPDVVVGL